MSYAHNLPFQSMCVALERARKIAAGAEGPWTVCVRDAQGAMLASASLDGYAQVHAFIEAMEDLGFVHSMLDAHEGKRSRDFAFRLRCDAEAEAGDLLHA
jgi:hypothetical protein